MELTRRQAEAIRFIKRFTDEEGYAPSVREVQIEVGHSSPSSTHHMLHTLRDAGILEWNPARPRTLRLKV